MIQRKGTHRVHVYVGHTTEDVIEMSASLGMNASLIEVREGNRPFVYDGEGRLMGVIKGDYPPYILLEFENPPKIDGK